MRRLIATTLACMALALFNGCGGESGPPTEPAGTPGITIISGSGVVDTVQAIVPPLVVELRDEAGYLLRNTDVQFEAEVIPVHNAPHRVPKLYIRTDKPYGDYAQAFTDENGRVTLQVALGAIPGPASITISALPRRIDVKVQYEVRPGAVARIELAPRDTLLTPGETFVPRIAVRDRHGNATPGAVALAARAPVVSIGGTSVRADTHGRTYVLAQVGDARDSMAVAVVPAGTIVAAATHGMVVVQTNGSGRRTLYPNGSAARWLADGQTVVFADTRQDAGTLRRINTLTGSVSSLVLGYPEAGTRPHPARAGDWIYFGRYIQASGGLAGTALWRVRPDGTGLTLVPGFVEEPGVYLDHPSPSPDGTRLAYVKRFGSVYVAAVGTGAVQAEVAGHSPEWSPTGEWIAYLDGSTLGVMRPDGSGFRTIGQGSYGPGLDWSPDGAWVIARSTTRDMLELVHVQSSLTIPLSFSAGMYDPTWKP